MKTVKAIVLVEAGLLLASLLLVGGALFGFLLPQINPTAGGSLRAWMTPFLPAAWQTAAPGRRRPPPPPTGRPCSGRSGRRGRSSTRSTWTSPSKIHS